MEDFREFLVGGGIILTVFVLVCVAFIAPVAILANWTEYVSGAEAIKQLRADMQHVSVQRSEDVVGQATDWNQRIRSNQRWNRVPIVCVLIPNGWDNIEPIPMPKD